MADTKVTPPKYGEHVTCIERVGTYEVVAVNSLMQTANIRSMDGNAPVIPNIAWTALKPLGRK
ncbi:MAG TPA: hypothetical protein VFW94_11115 [Candidatus Acidoferrales bacterium]|nr:hypothetical protein [Candidatus Acidoferrales bacterium]